VGYKTVAGDSFHSETGGLADRDRVDILIEEYRALYGLLLFRLTAMDRRLPVAGGTLGVLLGSVTVMPPDTKLIFLLGLPAALAWLLRTTANHARAKEDHLRRIDEIERQVNQIAGEELLVFQSRHPNRHRTVSGRTGVGTILAAFSVCLTMLAGCGYLFHPLARQDPITAAAYYSYLACVGAYQALTVAKLRRYRYRRPPPVAAPPFEARRAIKKGGPHP
jgi:hypothetical protein